MAADSWAVAADSWAVAADSLAVAADSWAVAADSWAVAADSLAVAADSGSCQLGSCLGGSGFVPGATGEIGAGGLALVAPVWAIVATAPWFHLSQSVPERPPQHMAFPG